VVPLSLATKLLLPSFLSAWQHLLHLAIHVDDNSAGFIDSNFSPFLLYLCADFNSRRPYVFPRLKMQAEGNTAASGDYPDEPSIYCIETVIDAEDTFTTLLSRIENLDVVWRHHHFPLSSIDSIGPSRLSAWFSTLISEQESVFWNLCNATKVIRVINLSVLRLNLFLLQ